MVNLLFEALSLLFTPNPIACGIHYTGDNLLEIQHIVELVMC